MADRPRILYTDPLPHSALHLFRPDIELVDGTALEPGAIRRAMGDADAVVTRSPTGLDRETLAGLHRLRAIGRAAAGFDNIDVAAATDLGIPVFNAPTGNTAATAELTFALILAATRRVPAADRALRDGVWDRKRFGGTQLQGKTLAIVGVGRIGSAVARRAAAFGVRILGNDPALTEDRARELGLAIVSLDRALAEADILTLHVPLDQTTRGMIGAPELQRMKPTAFLINAARGGVVDEAALVRALDDGSIAGAGLDVFTEEPLPADHPFLDLGNVVLTPHVGGGTAEAHHAVAVEALTAVRDALLHGTVAGAVNEAALRRESNGR